MERRQRREERLAGGTRDNSQAYSGYLALEDAAVLRHVLRLVLPAEAGSGICALLKMLVARSVRAFGEEIVGARTPLSGR